MNYIRPVNGFITCDINCHRQRTGGRINGVDIGDWLIYGRPIVATRLIKHVLFAGWAGDAGLTVESDLGDEWGIARDCHMSGLAVGIGQTNIPQGTVIGYVGSTGNSTGPHDHTEIRFKTKAAAERIAQGTPVYWDDAPAGFYIDPQVAWEFQEEDDMTHYIILQESDGIKRSFVYDPLNDRATYLTITGFNAMIQAEKAGKISLSFTAASTNDIKTINATP